MHRLQEMVRLHRRGYGAREVARLLTMSPNTEREYRAALIDAGLLCGPAEDLPEPDVLCAAVLARRPAASTPGHELSRIERWRPTIEKHSKDGLGPQAIFDRLRVEHAADFVGSYAQVKRMCRSVRRAHPVSPEDVAILVVTTPGDIAHHAPHGKRASVTTARTSRSSSGVTSTRPAAYRVSPRYPDTRSSSGSPTHSRLG